MSNFTLKIDPRQKFIDVAQINRRAENGRNRALFRMAAAIRTTARRSMRRGKRASKPGQPPRPRTGALKDNIRFIVDKDAGRAHIGPVRLPAIHPRILEALEFGGPSQTHDGRFVIIRPRPFMQPARDKIANDPNFNRSEWSKLLN